MNQYSDYNSYQPVDYTGYNQVITPDPVASGLVCEPDVQHFYPYFDEDTPRECTTTQVRILQCINITNR